MAAASNLLLSYSVSGLEQPICIFKARQKRSLLTPAEMAGAESVPVSWDEHLKMPLDKSCLEKVARVFWNVLSVLIPIIGIVRFLVYVMVRQMLLPSIVGDAQGRNVGFQAGVNISPFYFSFNENAPEREGPWYKAEEHWVETPDGVRISIKHLRCLTSEKSVPTCIYFPGNAEISYPYTLPALMSYCIEQRLPCNFVFFDYRGVGDSEGNMEVIQDLVIDGYSVVRWVEDVLQTPPDQIYFHGVSLGGAIATETKALNPAWSGPLVSDRSFSTLEEEVRALITEATGYAWMGRLAATIVKGQGHQLNPAAKIPQLEGRVAIVHHPEDPVIPKGARMHDVLKEEGEIFKFQLEGDLQGNAHCGRWNAEVLNQVGEMVFPVNALRV